MHITVGIPTRNRYDSLDKTLLSIALQTHKPHEVIIIDDTEKALDIREIPHYLYILRLLDDKGIKWRVEFGLHKGQHYSHQRVQEIAETDLIFRIDDDEVAEPDVLEKLYNTLTADEKCGAVAPAVTLPNPAPLPSGLNNSIQMMDLPNMQWFRGTGVYDADHLYSCFLYRKGIAKYELSLSSVAHREESIFTYSIKRAGYSIAVNMDAHVHHFQESKGGIRTFHDGSLWDHDERIFQGLLNLWGVGTHKRKVIILDNGIGDHYAFKNILPELRSRHSKITIAACYPDVFWDEEGLNLISIAEAKLMYGNIDPYNVYHFMEDHKWEGTLTEAFKALYL